MEKGKRSPASCAPAAASCATAAAASSEIITANTDIFTFATAMRFAERRALARILESAPRPEQTGM
jgi:hypothetical protein